MTNRIQATAADFFIGSRMNSETRGDFVIIAKGHNKGIWEARFDGGVSVVFECEASCYTVERLPELVQVYTVEEIKEEGEELKRFETAFMVVRGRVFKSAERKFSHDFKGFKGWEEVTELPQKKSFIGCYKPEGAMLSLLNKVL
ncbi:MAG: hypothetical protein ACRC2Y_04810 [Aeromonas veronii]